MQSVELHGLKEIQKKLEGFPKEVSRARREFFADAGPELLGAVRRRIGGMGRVAGVQGAYMINGYAAVRAVSRSESGGYLEQGKTKISRTPSGYVTNALENGHVARDNTTRVGGRYMYLMTKDAEIRRLTAEGAKEIERRAMAYLEGNG